jgi:hypothetical protein
MTPAKNRRNGFAMVTVIFLMSFAAMTLTVLTLTIFSQARRGQISSQDAELRQLLTAGASFAQTQLQSQNTFNGAIPLPDSLRGQSAELTINIDFTSQTQKTAEIQASLPHYHLSQKITFELQQNAWRPISATLSQ